jgi:hypothetical protein
MATPGSDLKGFLMRWFRDLITVVLIVMVLSVGVVGLMVEFPKFGGVFDRVSATGEGIVSAWRPGYGLFFLWLGLVCGTLLALLLSMLVRRQRMHVEVETADGRVCILDIAIKRYVQSALARVPGVLTKRVLLKHRRRGLQVEVYVLVRSYEKLSDLKQQLIDRVRKALTEDLGITSLGGIDVLIEDFEVRRKAEPVPHASSRGETVEGAVPAAVAAAVPAGIEESPFMAPRRAAFAAESETTPATPEPAPVAESSEASAPAQEAPRSRGLFGRWRRSDSTSDSAKPALVETDDLHNERPSDTPPDAAASDSNLPRSSSSEATTTPSGEPNPKESGQ